MVKTRSRENGRPVPAIPDPEVTPRAKRCIFSAAYKLRILREAKACNEAGVVGTMATSLVTAAVAGFWMRTKV